MISNTPLASLLPAQIDPKKLLVLLLNEGWRTAGGRENVYVRIRPPEAEEGIFPQRWSLLVPLNREAPDYSDLMNAALVELADSSIGSIRASTLLFRLRIGQADSFYFRKESAAPTGLISWRDGEELVRSARQTLAAGAKAHQNQCRRFSNRFGQFAGRYLDTVFMGQTAVGSYVVTAYAPADAAVALTSSKSTAESLPGLESSVPAREVTKAVGRALEATQEAVLHFRNTGKLSGFEAGVSQGVSYDFLTALQGITRNSDSGEVVLEWDVDSMGDGSLLKFEFTGSDTAVLEKASNQLSTDREKSAEVVVTGRVHLLTKKELGGPGVFGMETLESNPKKYRVRLSDAEEYHDAVKAHDRDLTIRVAGRIEKDGTLSWLYDASIRGITDNAEKMQNFAWLLPTQVEQSPLEGS